MKLFGNSKKSRLKKIEKEPVEAQNAVETEIEEPDVPAERERTPEEKKKIEEMIQQYQKKKMKRRIIILSVFCVIMLSFVIFISTMFEAPEQTEQDFIPSTPQVTNGTDPSPEVTASYRKEGFFTFVVVGKDQGNGNTDTMIVGAYDAMNKKLNVLNIPRDTMVNVPWSVKKVNTLMAFSSDPIEGLKTGLKDLLGFTVDNYIIVDLEAFVALVDTIGGVWFDVPVDMNYEDPKQDLYIHISKGYKHLNGEEAMKVIRFRSYPGADIERIATQQNFLRAVAGQLLQIENVTKIDDLASIFSEYVETDLKLKNIAWYGREFMGLKEDDIAFYTLPEFYNDSVKGLSYCTIMIDEWLKLLNECFNPFNERITVDHLDILTRDANGNLYATSGTIEGGIDSFYDNTKNEKHDPEPNITPPPASEAPEQSAPPAEETPPVEETPPAEETPPVAETPPAEETPPSEETPADEEAPASEEQLPIGETPFAESDFQYPEIG